MNTGSCATSSPTATRPDDETTAGTTLGTSGAALELDDAFGRQLRVGDVVTAVFRGPEMVPVLVPARVTGRAGYKVEIDPLADGPTLLDGTVITAGERQVRSADLVVRETGRDGSEHVVAGRQMMLPARDARGEFLSLGETVAFGFSGLYGTLCWGRGRLAATRATGVEVVVDADYGSANFFLQISAGQSVICPPAQVVRMGTVT